MSVENVIEFTSPNSTSTFSASSSSSSSIENYIVHESSRITLFWENINFSVDGDKHNEPRAILSDIAGIVEPGQVRN